MTKSILVSHASTLAYVYAHGRVDQIASFTDLYPTTIEPDAIDSHLHILREVDVIFTTWGFPLLTSAQLDSMPRLRAVLYAAGSVQGFAKPLLERGIKVVSAWKANGIPVAEYTLSQILLSCKGYFRNAREYHNPSIHAAAAKGPGIYGETVALLGFGVIGRAVRDLLRPFNLDIVVFDPFLSDDAACAASVRKVGLDEAFSTAIVVSNHLANKPETEKLIDATLFGKLRDGATFINTGRGATVDEPALVATLRARPDLTALLDVTLPEPAPPGAPLWSLPNAILTTHIAGSLNDEVVRMADYCIADCKRYIAGTPLANEVTLEMLATMA